MAFNATQKPVNDDATPEDIARWQKLFSYSYEQAAGLIHEHNHDFTRHRLTDDHWDMIRTKFEPQGYDKSAYEHKLAIGGTRPPPIFTTKTLSDKQARAQYVLKLEGVLSNAEKVRIAAGLSKPPECVQGEGDDGDATFCHVDGTSKQAILEWLSINAPSFIPTFARITQKADKDFSTLSLYPTLGIDSTLPQYRLADHNTPVEPRQEQHPVWYFFYGTLAQTEILSRHLGIPEHEPPVLYPATIARGKIETWAAKYKALVDAPASSTVTGSAYQVTTKEHEDALRVYETENYEVVRCTISIQFSETEVEKVQGCTFRFVGMVDGEYGRGLEVSGGPYIRFSGKIY